MPANKSLHIRWLWRLRYLEGLLETHHTWNSYIQHCILLKLSIWNKSSRLPKISLEKLSWWFSLIPSLLTRVSCRKPGDEQPHYLQDKAGAQEGGAGLRSHRSLVKASSHLYLHLPGVYLSLLSLYFQGSFTAFLSISEEWIIALCTHVSMLSGLDKLKATFENLRGSVEKLSLMEGALRLPRSIVSAAQLLSGGDSYSTLPQELSTVS